MTTYIADIDRVGQEMERPFLRAFVNGENDAQARAAAERLLGEGEAVRRVVLLQPILDDVLARPDDFAISWKSEGREGPVVLTDKTKVPADGNRAVPFGSDPEWSISLPWQTRAEARRLAKYLGLTLEEW